MNKRIIMAVIAVAVVVVGVLVAISLTGGDDGSSGSLEGVAEAREQFADLPQRGNTVGQADAPVEIVEYGDLACPACKAASETLVPELIDEFVTTGQARLTFRPIAFIHPQSSERGALGAEAAAMQDAMWPFVDVLYRNQGKETEDWLTEDLMARTAEALGLDVDKWRADYGSEAVASAFFEYRDQANEDNVDATPTFVLTGPNGERTISGVANLSEFEQAMAEVGPQS